MGTRKTSGGPGPTQPSTRPLSRKTRPKDDAATPSWIRDDRDITIGDSGGVDPQSCRLRGADRAATRIGQDPSESKRKNRPGRCVDIGIEDRSNSPVSPTCS
jgi:hypothetical protein